MNKKEYLLTHLMEECIEVAHQCAKALRFGLDDKKPGQDKTNAERIMAEYHDVQAAVIELQADGALDICFDAEAVRAKREKLVQMMKYSVSRGTLTPETQ